ncbi:unnamed protein product [Moneuplotes crassus]|uniref:Uncharacterized protein n=1 Tax=Euplotes crassus TaxID=5936 RepID=A0AAD1YA71_EUPCR|nr:unnamed protein product [Moneuplotes crassus]
MKNQIRILKKHRSGKLATKAPSPTPSFNLSKKQKLKAIPSKRLIQVLVRTPKHEELRPQTKTSFYSQWKEKVCNAKEEIPVQEEPSRKVSRGLALGQSWAKSTSSLCPKVPTSSPKKKRFKNQLVMSSLKKNSMKKSKMFKSKKLTLSHNINKRRSVEPQDILFLNNSQKVQLYNQSSQSNLRYTRKICNSACDTRYHLRSSTPDGICNKSLSQTISKYMNKQNITNPTECATPANQNHQEVSVGTIDPCWKCKQKSKLCTCQVALSVPSWLLKKLETPKDEGKATKISSEIYSIGLKLLKEHTNENGVKFLQKIEESLDSKISEYSTKLSSCASSNSLLQSKVDSLTKSLSDLTAQFDQSKQEAQCLKDQLRLSAQDLSQAMKDFEQVNEALKATMSKLKKSQNYEKRLMYLIFLACEEGYPVDKLYEANVGKLSSRIFEDMSSRVEKDEVTSMFKNCPISHILPSEREVNLISDSYCGSSQIFDSKASYEPIKYYSVQKISKKPSQVALLDFAKLQESSSISNRSASFLDFKEEIIIDKLLRFRKCRSHDDIFLSLCSETERT